MLELGKEITMISVVRGKKAFFCTNMCKEGFVSDRDLGVVYGPYFDNGNLVSAEEASMRWHACAYCGELVEPPGRKPEFPIE